MQRKILFASITFAATCAALAACSGDDNTVAPAPTPDSGAPDTSLSDANHGGDTSNAADSNSAADTNSAADSNASDSNSAADSSDAADSDAPDSNLADSSTPDAADAGCTGVELTVQDTENWCTITIGNGTPFSSGQQIVCVASGSTTNLSATPNSASFVTGTWHGTDTPGDNFDAGPGTADTTTITVGDGGTACAWICCPGPGGSGPSCTVTGCL